VALPKPVTLRDELTLISPVDDAIDFDQLDRDDPAWANYQIGETGALDVDTIPLREGAVPVWLTARPLDPRELNLVRNLSGISRLTEDDVFETRVLATAAMTEWATRLALVRVEGCEGWNVTRERRHGRRIWPERALTILGTTTVDFIGVAIVKMSTIPFDPGSPSGS